jgi:hypothetical protein
MQKTFFPQFRNGGLTSTSYSDLTKSLLEIWKDGKMTLIDNMQNYDSVDVSAIKPNVLSLTDGFTTTPGSPSPVSVSADKGDVEGGKGAEGAAVSAFSFSAKPADWVQQGIGASRKNQRRGSRKVRKEKGREKAALKFSTVFVSPDNYRGEAEDLEFMDSGDDYGDDSNLGTNYCHNEYINVTKWTPKNMCIRECIFQLLLYTFPYAFLAGLCFSCGE